MRAISVGEAEYYSYVAKTAEMPEGASFCLELTDNATSPYFPAGTKVYVDASASPAAFEAGVFYIGGRVVCRQCCEDYSGSLRLLPSNPGMESLCISVSASERSKCLCLGKIITEKKLPRPVFF